MDSKSLKTLEFNKVLAILADYTSFSGGEDLVHNLHPTTDLVEARRWQAETAEAIKLLNSHTSITLGGARDVRRPVDNAYRGFTLPAEDLINVRGTIIAGRNLKRSLLRVADDFPTLTFIAELIEECPGIVSAIGNTFDERGKVVDSASPQLLKIRQQQRVVYSRIQDKLQRILNSKSNQYLQDPIITQRAGRYVIPLKAEAQGRIKGIVHDHSGSGATLWIEPFATVDLNNEYRNLQIQEQDEVSRILAELSKKVADQGEAIKRVVERLAEIDLIFARARYADLINAIPPEFVEWRTFEQPSPPKHANERAKWTPPPPNLHPGSTIWVKGARHPLLPSNDVVPTNLTLDEETFTVLITGPNTGGKTVSLKTMGLMALMAQSGLHLPAIEARLTIFNNVFADIGDEQSIEQSLSTFSAHVTNVIRILENVDDRSLVLFDELGSGTDPAEGAALAQAITNYLRDQGATTFIATHYPELKLYAAQTKGVTNASLLFDIETLSPTYEMTIGIPGRSNAFAIARRLGMDDTVLEDGLRLLGRGNQEAENMLDAIYELREKMLSDEAATRLALRDAERERDALYQRLDEIEAERQQILAKAHTQAEAEVEAVQDELRRLRRHLRDTGSLNQLKKINKELEDVVETKVAPIEPTVVKADKPRRPTQFREGDTVLVKTLNTKGEIISINKKEAVIAIGRLHMRAQLSELELKERASKPEEDVADLKVPTAVSPGMELDMRGQRVEEGVAQLERYLDAAFLARLPWVRIIHGKGTGKLRVAVRKHLKTNKHVNSWEEGKLEEGGAGVTVAKLVDQNN